MDGISPVSRSEVDARIELARLAEILPQAGRHMRTLGVADDAVEACQHLADTLRSRMQTARADALMAVARS